MARQGDLHARRTTKLQVHLVGSVPLSSNTEAFKCLATAFPNNLLRMPDGETGIRQDFVRWQGTVFSNAPFVANKHGQATVAKVDYGAPITLKPVGYDNFALASYAEFRKLREQGIIPPGMRFQVSLPTPINVISGHVSPEYQPEVEILYEKALIAALRRIQDIIPKHDLAIQWDAAREFAMIEKVESSSIGKPWFDPLISGLNDRFARLVASVDPGVELGFHLCYGDMNHRHFVEPKDTRHLVEMANAISRVSSRDINWIHIPVPKNRTDAAYFDPLKCLKLKKETKIYLGLAHPWDVDGTWKRIETASKVLDDFGIASECGMGRTSKKEFKAVIEVLGAVAGSSVS